MMPTFSTWIRLSAGGTPCRTPRLEYYFLFFLTILGGELKMIQSFENRENSQLKFFCHNMAKIRLWRAQK